MQVPVGPFNYRVELTMSPPIVHGAQAVGACDPDRQVISVFKGLIEEKRISVFWHELAHAWKAELDIHDDYELGEEAFANLIGLAMSAMGPKLLSRLHVFLTQDMVCDNIQFIEGLDDPIPVLYWETKSGGA